MKHISSKDNYPGIKCEIDANKRRCVNIEQKLWIESGIGMSWGKESGVAGKHLALNVLFKYLPETMKDEAYQLYEPFFEDVIYDMPDTGASIDADQIELWLCRKMYSCDLMELVQEYIRSKDEALVLKEYLAQLP